MRDLILNKDNSAGETASEDAEYVRLRDKYNSAGLSDDEYQRWRALDDARRSALPPGTYSVLGYDGEIVSPPAVPEPVPTEGAVLSNAEWDQFKKEKK